MTRAFGAYCSLTIFRFCQKEAGVFVRSSKNSRRLREKIDILTKSVILDKKGQVSGKGNGRMLITRELDYAIRTLRALHRHGQLSAAAVAELEHMPKAITLKTLSRLHGAGIVESRRGIGGGYVLRRPCRELTLLDLSQALDEPPLLNRCQKEGYCCENHPEGGCGICRELNRVQSALNLEFQRTPLSDIFA